MSVGRRFIELSRFSWKSRKRSIRSSFFEVKKVRRVEALRKVDRRRGEKDRVKFMVKYNPRLPKFSEPLRPCCKILTEDSKIKCLPISTHGMLSESGESEGFIGQIEITKAKKIGRGKKGECRDPALNLAVPFVKRWVRIV